MSEAREGLLKVVTGDGVAFSWDDEMVDNVIAYFKRIGEFRHGPFQARFPEDANMVVFYSLKFPELFGKEEE